MPRNDSSIWDWPTASPPSSTPASSRDVTPSAMRSAFKSSREGSLRDGSAMVAGSRDGSLRGGILFDSSRENSAHGGNRMRRNVSFTNIEGTAVPERISVSLGPTAGLGSLRRNGSWLFDWHSATPPASLPASREPSVHGSSFYPKEDVDFGLYPKEEVDAPPTGFVGGMQRSLSFLWDWGRYRPASQPVTPGSSLRAGTAFGATKGDTEPAVMPPKAMTKSLSIGSYMWHWGGQRVSPPSTPGTSQHGAKAFAPEALTPAAVPVH